MLVAHAGIQFTILASCGPTVAAVVTNRLASGSYRAFRLNVSWLRTLGAGVLGVLLIVLTYAVLPASAIVDPWKLHWSALLSTHVYNYSTLLGGPLFEEPGWRGFALPRLESRLSPISSSLVLGVLWTGWHLPLFLYPGWTTYSVWTYLLLVSGISVLMSLGANLARFGVIAPIAMHAITNTTHEFFQGLFANTPPDLHQWASRACGTAREKWGTRDDDAKPCALMSENRPGYLSRPASPFEICGTTRR